MRFMRMLKSFLLTVAVLVILFLATALLVYQAKTVLPMLAFVAIWKVVHTIYYDIYKDKDEDE